MWYINKQNNLKYIEHLVKCWVGNFHVKPSLGWIVLELSFWKIQLKLHLVETFQLEVNVETCMEGLFCSCFYKDINHPMVSIIPYLSPPLPF